MFCIRSGIGIDIHSFNDIKKNDNFIILGGVKIQHDYMINAHSDGDVVLHSITESILGAIAEGNIGVHFPNTNERWKGCDSSVFIKYAVSMMTKKQWMISNIDVSVVCEAPKIMKYSKIISANIAKMINITDDQINIKATTSEGMGFLGRREGIAAYAVCTLVKMMDILKSKNNKGNNKNIKLLVEE